jgi:predicted acyl esterase
MLSPQDAHDVIDWIVKQPWCDGNVGMMGACAFAGHQLAVASLHPHPNLKAINPFEALGLLVGDVNFHGIFDAVHYSVTLGRHGNDSSILPRETRKSRLLENLSEEELQETVAEVLEHPDVKYNSKYYGLVTYPSRAPNIFDSFVGSFHPKPRPILPLEKIDIPTFLSTPWNSRIYIWDTFYAWEKIENKDKKFALWPGPFPDRPFVDYADETVRWHDHWLKGIDTGITDEPPIKIFVMGINKWRFENEWPLARTEWTKYYLQSGGGLSKTQPGSGEPESFSQPAVYKDPTVYCLKYQTEPFEQDMEMTGPIALYLHASIDIDDTNWMVDLIDVDPDGNRMMLTTGYLKARHRAIDEANTRPYAPAHPREEGVPVPEGEVIEYAIQLMPASNMFQKGHQLELVVRNQDDLLCKQGIWGVNMLPFQRDVTHTIHFGDSHLLLPVIPGRQPQT